MATKLKRISASGAIFTGGAWLRSVILTPAAAVATLTLDNSADGSGTDLLTLQAAANGNSVIWQSTDRQGSWHNVGIHATLAGAGAIAMVEYNEHGQ